MQKKLKIKTIFVLGGPGSGKGTLCKKLKEFFNCEHLSCGDILRNIVDKKEYKNWKNIENKVNSGGFLKPQEMVELIKYEYNNLSKSNIIFLDGFPRIKENDEEWYKTMTEISDIIGVLYLECSKETMKKRILERKDIRNDKDISTIEKRISHFYEQTIPIIDEYTKKNLTIKISSEQDIEEVFKEAINKLKTLIY